MGDTVSRRTKIVAHRGASTLAPENTMSSIEAALKLDVDMIEVDVRTTWEGEIVLMHDSDVSRTTDGSGLVSELTIQDLASLDAGSWFSPRFLNEEIPTLDQALEAVRGTCGLCIEVKDAAPSEVLARVQTHQCLEQVVIFDFNHERLYEMREISPEIQTLALGVTRENLGDLNTDIFDAIGSHKSQVCSPLVDSAHELGLEVFVYTVDDGVKAREMISMGADAIITNDPQKIMKTL